VDLYCGGLIDQKEKHPIIVESSDRISSSLSLSLQVVKESLVHIKGADWFAISFPESDAGFSIEFI
jgi:hypothetical protein